MSTRVERYESGLRFQNGHTYYSMHGDGVCNCGRSLFNGAHFPSIDAATAAYRATMRVQRSAIEVGTHVIINNSHPNPDRVGLTGVVTYVGRDVVEVEHPSKAGMVHGYLLHQLTVSEVALEPVPQFATVEEADAWLEERNPIPDPAIPCFTSVMQAEEWIEEQRRKKEVEHAERDAEAALAILKQGLAKNPPNFKFDSALILGSQKTPVAHYVVDEAGKVSQWIGT